MVPSLLRVASLAWLRRCSRRRALAERIALKTPLQAGGWGVLPDDIGTELTRDFPDLMRARYEKFGRGGRGISRGRGSVGEARRGGAVPGLLLLLGVLGGDGRG